MPTSLQSQIERQELVLQEGEVAMSYRDANAIYNAIGQIAARYLPTKQARIHFARCRRIFKVYADEHMEERQRIQHDHAPVASEETMGEGDKLQFRDALGMTRELAELDALLVAVRLPSKITDAMLPVNDKAHPNNEDGLALWIADLGPLYEISPDGE